MIYFMRPCKAIWYHAAWSTHPNPPIESVEREREIKFIGLMGNRGHRGQDFVYIKREHWSTMGKTKHSLRQWCRIYHRDMIIECVTSPWDICKDLSPCMVLFWVLPLGMLATTTKNIFACIDRYATISYMAHIPNIVRSRTPFRNTN